MRNFTPQGELKVATDATGSGDDTTPTPTLLASGYISPLAADADGIATLQALSVAEDLNGIALAQTPGEDVPLTLESAAASLIPPRFITLTSIADLSAITFEIVGLDQDGSTLDENLAGPAGAPVDADGIALSQAPTIATPLVLEAAAASLDPPRLLTFTSAADLSGVNFAIVGLDENGDPQSVPAFVGPNNTTVTTVERWSEVTSITPDATDVGTLTVGWPDTSATVTSANAYSAVTAITPDGTDAANVEAGWPASSQPFALSLDLTSFDPARRVTLTSLDDLSSVDFQLSGTDEDGAPLTETLTGPDNATVTSLARFATVNSIFPLMLGTGDISAGWPAEPATLYTAPSTVEISHVYLRNTDVLTQLIELFLWTGSAQIPWRQFELAEDESASVLFGEQSLPLPAGAELRATTDDPDVVSFTVHGRESA